MKIYMDTCCYFRPFDDQTQDRILLESDAVLSVIFRCNNGDWSLLGSDVLDYEISRVKDDSKFTKVNAIYQTVKLKINLTDKIQNRANELRKFGIDPMDALHLASAESGGADVYLTTDDELIKRAGTNSIGIAIYNPVNWMMEVTGNE